MLTTVTAQQRQAARRELVRQIEQGASAREARVSSVVSMHRTTVYRLLKRVQREDPLCQESKTEKEEAR